MSRRAFHLASASSRRRQLLMTLGFEFSYRGVDIDESPRAGEPAADMVVRLAVTKARTALESGDCRVPVLAADTTVVLGDRIFGKPASKGDALEMLTRLSGRTHQVLTGVAVAASNSLETAVSTTDVRFRDIRPDEAEAYWHSGEPAGKAGAYAVQGLGGIFVIAINGSFTSVVGLPVFETAQLLGRAGVVPPGMPDYR